MPRVVRHIRMVNDGMMYHMVRYHVMVDVVVVFLMVMHVGVRFMMHRLMMLVMGLVINASRRSISRMPIKYGR